MSIIVILNYSKASLTKTQVQGIVESIEEEIRGRGDGNCLVQKSVVRALDLLVEDGVEGVPLSNPQWGAYAVIPYIPQGRRGAMIYWRRSIRSEDMNIQ